MMTNVCVSICGVAQDLNLQPMESGARDDECLCVHSLSSSGFEPTIYRERSA
jgi:hypothetical protein